MAPIEPLRIPAIELLHKPGEVSLRSFQKQMVVGGHEAVAMHPEPEGGVQVVEEVQETRVVGLISEDDALLQPSIDDMVERARVGNA